MNWAYSQQNTVIYFVGTDLDSLYTGHADDSYTVSLRYIVTRQPHNAVAILGWNWLFLSTKYQQSRLIRDLLVSPQYTVDGSENDPRVAQIHERIPARDGSGVIGMIWVEDITLILDYVSTHWQRVMFE